MREFVKLTANPTNNTQHNFENDDCLRKKTWLTPALGSNRVLPHCEGNQLVLLTGKKGQMTRAFKGVIGEQSVQVGRPELDFSRPHEIQEILADYSPSCLINCAGYTQVNRAQDEKDLAETVNVTAVKELALYCEKKNIPLIHLSTDYVFDGSGNDYWKESDVCNPINFYGQTKLHGEIAVQENCSKHLIIRTSWIYDEEGQNFLNRILEVAKSRDVIKVVNDQKGAPTYAHDVAQGTWDLYQNLINQETFASGIYNVTNSDITTWHEFAVTLFELAHPHLENSQLRTIEPVLTEEFGDSTPRPLNSRLSMQKLNDAGVVMPHWRDALTRCLDNKFGVNHGI